MPSSPKNILYFSSFGNLRWGGQKSLYHLVTRLDRQKYSPVVLLPSDEDFAEALRAQGVEVVIHQLPPIGLFNIFKCFSSIRYLLSLIETQKIALMHTDGPRNTFYAGIVSWLNGLPVVFHVRSSDRDRYDRIIYRCADRIILVAGALRERFHYMKDNKKFTTIYNGVDLSHFERNLSDLQTDKAHTLSGNGLSIVCVGRIEPRKGQHDLIEACAILKDRKIPFLLLLAGEIANERYLNKCLNKAEDLKMKDQVTFAGHIENIQDVLYLADIFVLPSSSGEAFSRAIIEAMAAGKSVVATNVGGAREAVEDGISGYIVPPSDPAALAEKILALAVDESLRQKVGCAARKRVEELFTIEKNVKKTEQIYAELLEGIES